MTGVYVWFGCVTAVVLFWSFISDDVEQAVKALQRIADALEQQKKPEERV